jgi:hypothetical protein
VAQIKTIIANLPSLIRDRTDALKLETVIRYLGDIIFDASQNPTGDKAKWLVRVLTATARTDDLEPLDSTLTLFRDGYLERYADYSAWKAIVAAARSSSGPTKTGESTPDAPIEKSPKIVALTRILNRRAPESGPSQTDLSGSAVIGTFKPRIDASGRHEVAAVLKTKNEAPHRAEANRIEGNRALRTPDHGQQSGAKSGLGAEEPSKTPTTSFEITSLQDAVHSPFEFAKCFKAQTDLRGSYFPV